MMTLQHTERRLSPRSLTVCPISISFPSATAHGILRDISAGGIFFYSNFKPSLHANINFSLRIDEKSISGKGEVVRVQQAKPGAAVGVAVEVSSYDLG